MAEKFNFPMVFQSSSSKAFFQIMRKNLSKFSTGLLLNFNGSLGTHQEMLEFIDMGLFISVSGSSLKDSSQLTIIKALPLERIVL